MANVASVIGAKQIISNLAIREAKMALSAELGLKAAGLTLQRASQLKVPVDTGNLKASAFTRMRGLGWSAAATVGFTANYALFVHEAVGMKLKGKRRTTKGKYWDPQNRAQAKFLEEPARTLRPVLFAVFKKFVNI